MYKLRKYQNAAVAAGLKVFDQKKKPKSGIIVLPTGSGKSLVIAEIARQLDGHTLVFQPSKEILEQNLQKTIDFGFTDVGVFSASAGRKDFGKITFATIGSVMNRKEEFEHFQNIIIDECHEVNAKGGMYKEFIEWSGGRLLGLTATAYRLHTYYDNKTDDRAVVAKFLHRTRPKTFDEIVHITQVKELYDLKFLCPIEYHKETDYVHSAIKLNTTGMDFDREALKKYNEKSGLVGKVARSVALHKAKHTLVFCVFVEEAETLSAELRELGITAATISAKTPAKEREQMIADFKNGTLQVVTNVGVLTTGFDFPALDCVILARPTQSVALYYQMVGRGIRIAPNKESVKVIDLCGNVDRFGKIEEFEIVEEKKKLHRLKSNVSFLTGFDFVSNQDLEIGDYVGKTEREIAPVAIGVMPFGKHKGIHITKLPNEYLLWCAENFESGKWKTAFATEANRRALGNRPVEYQDPNALPF